MPERSRCAIAVFLCLLSAGAGWAVGAEERSFEVTTLVTPGAMYSDIDGLDFDLGLGLGLGWRFRPEWGVDGRVSFDDGTGLERRKYDLGLRRAVKRWEAWSSHASLGLHHRETEIDHGPCGPPQALCLSAGPRQEDATGAFVGFDLDRRFAEAVALRLDGRYSVYDSEDSLDLSVGFAFRF